MTKIKQAVEKIKALGQYLVLPWFLSRLYIKILVFGLVLVGLNYSYLQNLSYCTNVFGEQLCSPYGVYLIALASIPGYLVINALLPKVAADNDALYAFIVFVTSLLVYSMIGYFFSRNRRGNKSSGAILLIFLILLFALLVLVSLVRG